MNLTITVKCSVEIRRFADRMIVGAWAVVNDKRCAFVWMPAFLPRNSNN